MTATAFNNVGAITTLSPGQSVGWNYFYPGNFDHGPVMATADIKPSEVAVIHLADRQMKQKFLDETAMYFVTITNEGSAPGFHNLQGGALT